jgi:hypothetical protein
MHFPGDPSAPRCVEADPWLVRHNAEFAREGRCLLFADYSRSLRDCHACRTIAWCNYYDHLGVRQPDRLALARWEDDGGIRPFECEQNSICPLSRAGEAL